MTLFQCFCLFLGIFVTVSSAEEFNGEEIPVVEGYHVSEDNDVLVLTEKNFDGVIKANQIILVEFYAPWCGHCKTLAPEYQEAAKTLKNENPSIPLAKIDATIQDGLAKRFEVTGFPTIFLFKKGEKKEYDGPRSASGIVEYMKREADPNYKPPPSLVFTLTQDNFTDWVSKQALALVEFYAPWCGHCKRLEPEFERAAALLDGSNIKLAKVDSTLNKDLSDRFEVQGYPTLFIFRKGSHLRYQGPREEKGIVSYMKEQAKPPSELIENKSHFDKISMGKTYLVTVIGFFQTEQDKLFEEFISAANTQRGQCLFYHVLCPKLLSASKTEAGNVALYQPEHLRSKYEPVRQLYHLEEDDVYQDIVNFLEKHRLPLVGQRTSASSLLYDKRYPLVVVYYDVDFGFENRAQTQLVRDQVLQVAKDYTSQGDPTRALTFCISKEDEFAHDLVDLGLEDSGEDVNVGFYITPSVRYPMPPTDEFNAHVLRSFISNVLKGKMKPKIKSQLVPKNEKNQGPVVKVVGASFHDIVLHGKFGEGGRKNVLIEFFAPWCQHCKKLAPKYAKLAQKLSDSQSDQLIVAQMDATTNDIPSELFKVDGYPAIFFVSHTESTEEKAKPKVVKYKGASWEIDDIEKFVLEQLGDELDQYVDDSESDKNSEKDEL